MKLFFSLISTLETNAGSEGSMADSLLLLFGFDLIERRLLYSLLSLFKSMKSLSSIV
jgi:hypothetical protein